MKEKKNSLKTLLRYKFDNTMSKGTPAMIIWLGLISLIVILLAAAVIVILDVAPEGEESLGFFEAFWRSMMRTLDAGTMGGDTGWGFRIIQFLVTLGGIFIISTLIGVLSSGIESILSNLRKGRSFVVEENHTLILGWSPKVFTIISELVIANENQKKPRIVILAEKDKIEMEDEIRDNINTLKNTKLICRSGNPHNLIDLDIVNPHASKSIIILSDEDQNADSQTIKTILAITNNPGRRNDSYHIVAEIKDEKNLEVAKMISNNEVEIVLTDDIVSRIMTQTSRQSGLSVVYTEIMDFGGDEIYFNEEKLLTGKTYSDSIMAYEDSAVIGIQNKSGEVMLNLEADYLIQEGDKIIAITEDDDTLVVNENNEYKIIEDAIVKFPDAASKTEKTLLLGWNKRAYTIIKEMDSYSSPGSELKVISTYPVSDDDKQNIQNNITKLKVEYITADTTKKEVLDSLSIASYDHILLLCYKDELGTQEADAVTLVTLLHLRHISDSLNKNINIVSEMLDIHNRELAEVTKADDFIVSDRLISLLMTQVSENKYLMRVFEKLFESEGSEIYLKPASRYIKTGIPVNFYTVARSALLKNETAMGYRQFRYAYDSDKAYGIVVNPVKSELVTFEEGDKIIVLAED